MKHYLLLALLLITISSKAQYWNTTGNSGTLGDFLGTTGSVSLEFRANNIKSGFVDLVFGNTGFGQYTLNNLVHYISDDSYYNTAVGYRALQYTNVGFWNTGIGAFSLQNNQEGQQNTAIGFRTLQNNTTGGANSAGGTYSLHNNTTGGWNTGWGLYTLIANTTGNYNTAIGFQSSAGNISGSSNTAVGKWSLYNNTYGYSNVAMGAGALYSNTTWSNLVAIGDSALYNQITGEDLANNTAVGSKSLYSNTIGHRNTALGFKTLNANILGKGNTSIGCETLINNLNSFNTAVGALSATSNTSGANNSCLGYQALNVNTTGNNNTAIGYYANVSANNLNNATAIGANAIVDASDKIFLGDANVTLVESYGTFNSISDGRFKTDVKANVKGLEFINQLRPVTYKLDRRKITEFKVQYFTAETKDKILSKYTEEIDPIIQTGFIAQEVLEAANKKRIQFNGIHQPSSLGETFSLSYERFVVPLVKSVQELSAENDKKDQQIKDLTQKFDDLQKQLVALTQKLNNVVETSGAIKQNLNYLEQNAPNPFNNSSLIKYDLSAIDGISNVIITDMNGRIIKSIAVSPKSKGQVQINAGELVPGTYVYSLQVNGKLLDSKQMVILK